MESGGWDILHFSGKETLNWRKESPWWLVSSAKGCETGFGVEGLCQCSGHQLTCVDLTCTAVAGPPPSHPTALHLQASSLVALPTTQHPEDQHLVS